jgi:hypothetical protein
MERAYPFRRSFSVPVATQGKPKVQTIKVK